MSPSSVSVGLSEMARFLCVLMLPSCAHDDFVFRYVFIGILPCSLNLSSDSRVNFSIQINLMIIPIAYEGSIDQTL